MCFLGLISASTCKGVQMFLCTSVCACLWARVQLWGYFGACLCAHMFMGMFVCTCACACLCMHTQGREHTGT